jgi:hypothetical protein
MGENGTFVPFASFIPGHAQRYGPASLEIQILDPLRDRVHGQTRSQLGAFLEIWQEPVMARGTSGHRRMD